MRSVSRDVWLKNALLEPRSRLWLNDDLLGHNDLLSGRTGPRGDQDYAKYGPADATRRGLVTLENCRPLRNGLRIIVGLA
jgi:hypothetical protein